MMKILFGFLLLILSCQVTGQTLHSGEYRHLDYNNSSFFKNVQLVLNCNKTFLFSDSTFVAWGNWKAQGKNYITLTIDTSKLTNSTTRTESYIKKIKFFVKGDTLVLNKLVKASFRKMATYPKEHPIFKAYYKKAEKGNNSLVRLTLFKCD